MTKTITLALLATACGGQLDPLSGGGGGDPSLLHPTASACTSFVATKTDFDAGPQCTSPAFTQDDVACEAWVHHALPPNWPNANQCNAGRCELLPTTNTFPKCKTGAAGDEYCAAWASQFVRDGGTPLEGCAGFEGNDVNGWCFADDIKCAGGCAFEQLCVERNGVATCEDLCQ